MAAGAAPARRQPLRTVLLIDLACFVGYQVGGTVSESKLLGKLLRLEGMKVTGFDIADDLDESAFRKLTLWVKPRTGADARCASAGAGSSARAGMSASGSTS
jgi:hypothetical protein